MARSTTRRGFSLVELLVVIAIIGILLSLMLPAVQRARENARGVQCRNNLKQIGIALAGYEELHRVLPPASIWARPPGETLDGGRWAVGILDRVALGYAPGSEDARMMANWAIMILPFIEEGNLHKQYNSELPVSDPENEVVRTKRVATYICPSDIYNNGENMYDRTELSSQPDNLYARGNYAINMGPNRGCFKHVESGQAEWPTGGSGECADGFSVDGERIYEDNTEMWGNGIAGVNKSFDSGDVRSGTSNFIAVDEIRAGVHKLDVRGSWALGFIGASVTARHGVVSMSEDGAGPNNQDVDSDDIFGCTALHQAVGATYLSDVGMPCYSGGLLENEVNFQQTARSMHTAGVFTLRLDGSVHWVGDGITPEIWAKLHNRNTREIIGDDDL
ncbi:MAG: prepilin-type cleavage/methylation domain-containing protein [Planctomyces sp.]|nr:prepilin-type cleavage/methylation domain-containing protein [Planctomyces sp.]